MHGSDHGECCGRGGGGQATTFAGEDRAGQGVVLVTVERVSDALGLHDELRLFGYV